MDSPVSKLTENMIIQLLPLSEAEQAFKEMIRLHPEFATCSTDMNARKIAAALPDFSGRQKILDLMNNRLTELDFIPDGYNVSIKKHLRYLPTIIHSHEFIEIYCVVNGNCQYLTGDLSIDLQQGDIMIVPPDVSHGVSVFSDECIAYNLLVRVSAFNTAFLGLLSDRDILADFFSRIICNAQPSSYVLFRCGPDSDVLDLVFCAAIEHDSDHKYRNRMVDSVLAGFFITLLRNHDQDVIVANPVQPNENVEIVEILNYLQANFKTLSIGDLSRKFNYSSRQMSRILREYTSHTFSELIHRIRLDVAVLLLKNPNISISQIIEAAGYSDASHFYRVFKAAYGCAPNAYRTSN